MIADKDWRLGLAMIMAVLTLAVAAPAPASAATSCRYGNEGDIYGAPVVQRLRVTRVPCFAAGLVADNIVEYWNEHKRRLPRHWPANVSRWRCSYQGSAYVKRARCTFAPRRAVVHMTLRFPV